MYLPCILPKTKMRDLHCSCTTHIMDQKFASKGPNGGVLWLLWKAKTSQKNQQPKLVVCTCDKITKWNVAWKLRLMHSEKDTLRDMFGDE